jgi:hypothetical protein
MEQHRAGYYVWLNDQSFWYPDLASAAKKSAEVMNYCGGEDSQVYDIKRGRKLNPDELYEDPWRVYC